MGETALAQKFCLNEIFYLKFGGFGEMFSMLTQMFFLCGYFQEMC